MTVGDFLLRRLNETGVRHLFGVPGDYNLELLQQLHDGGALKWVGTCSELNSVGALLGTLTAAPERRYILFVGDGSFQVTAQELSTILRHDHRPVILLINNGGYAIERGYLGRDETYNDIASWTYAALPTVFRRDTSARSFVVKTVGDLQEALAAPNDSMIFVESIMDPHDALAPMTNSSNTGADLDADRAVRNTVKTCSFAQGERYDPCSRDRAAHTVRRPGRHPAVSRQHPGEGDRRTSPPHRGHALAHQGAR